MQSWIIYGLAAAVMIASRDLFTKSYTKKYTASEHILYYYVLCGIIIAGYSCYRKFHMKENIRMIEKGEFLSIDDHGCLITDANRFNIVVARRLFEDSDGIWTME